MTDCAVLHVTSLMGGGVDRHVRDISRGASRAHLIWHASETADVIEDIAGRRYLPLDREAFARDPAALEGWLRRERVGIVHAHSVSRASRSRAAWAAAALGARHVATLHDVLFLRADGFEPGAAPGADAAWLAETSGFLREAAAVAAPSDYLAGVARRNIPGLDVTVIPNGSRPRAAGVPRKARPEFEARRPRHVVAVLGAIGPHKGSALIEELAQLLAGTGIAIAIVGYLDAQIVPGWRNGNLFIHGTYDDADVPALFAAYGASLALFPNRVPESFSYALSDTWAAGLPAIVPSEGALGERVSRHGAGWLLRKDFNASDVDALLRRLFSPGGAQELAQVKSQLSQPDPGRVPPLDTMTRSLDALYARFGIDPAAPVDPMSPPVQELLAKNIDGSVFRPELVRLADEIVQLRGGLEAERARFTAFEAEARGWIAKLEGDIAQLQAEVTSQVEANRALGQENVQLAIHKDAFDLLPELIRKLLLKKILDARS
jgi:glycosyltransferase involved in cell wall biosynthesis